MSTRVLGVGAAVVDGSVLPGDVIIDDDGTVVSVGVAFDGHRSTIAVPGLVDLQVNGFAGVDLRHADPDDYRTAAKALAAHGATAVQPTFHGMSVDGYLEALHGLDVAMAAQRSAAAAREAWGCRLLDAHLEGPFLNPLFNGAHDGRTFLPPSTAVADRLVDSGRVGFMTVAPELPGGMDLVAHLVRRGVVVSIGHSDADVTATVAAVGAGARHLTHCWNAHRRLTARDPGPAAVALVAGELVVGLIADGVHVADEILRLTLGAAEGRVAATTDAIAPAGLPGTDGVDPIRWEDPAAVVTVRDGRACLDDGTLAGSVATPVDVLRHLVAVGLDLPAALDACGGVQRRLLGLDDVRVRPGDVADLVVVDDALRVERTLVGGREVAAGV